MKFIIFLILARYAARCDNASNNNYVVEMLEDELPLKELRKPFQVYWNVPTMQCKSKRIPFKDLYGRYGIIQNENDSFRGESIAILYDPGLFPALLKNDTSGEFKFRNGGVPQEGDLEKHINIFKSVLVQSIPDPNFSGVGIIDFESWRPVFRQNFGVLVPYKDVSYEVERKLHWWWPKPWIQAEVKKRFEEAARVFMQNTLSIAKQIRPNAVWGYYGYPYCFNMAGNNMAERCADKVPQENNNIYWLWSESTALYPSVYSSRQLTKGQLAALIKGRVAEATRLRRPSTHILPYFWFRYRDGGYMADADLKTVLQTLYRSNASGFIIWGSSNDVNTVEKCVNLLKYVENIMGPAIAKYTKRDLKIQDELLNVLDNVDNNNNDINNNTDDNTTLMTTLKPILNQTTLNTTELGTVVENTDPDPEFDWDPPENYTQDIVKHVKEEFLKKNLSSSSNNDKDTDLTVYINSKRNESLLVDMILSTFYDKVQKSENDSDTSESDIIKISKNNENILPENTEFLTSTMVYNTKDIDEYNLENSTFLINEVTTDSVVQSENKDVVIAVACNLPNSKPKQSIDIESTTTNYQSDLFYNKDTLFSPMDTFSTTLGSVEINEYVPEDIGITEYSTENLPTELPLDSKDTIVSDNRVTENIETVTDSVDTNSENNNVAVIESVNKNPGKEVENFASLSTSNSSTGNQMSGSASHNAIRNKYFICIFFYFYSVSKCFCDIYGQCS